MYVISAMLCHRIISIIGGFVLLATAIAFILLKFFDSGLLFFMLSVVQFTGFGLSFQYAMHYLTLISFPFFFIRGRSLIADGVVVLDRYPDIHCVYGHLLV